MSLIIDPGHGGKDPGGGTNIYFKEKDWSLEISLYIYRRLKELEVPVKITRTTDKYLSPEERTRIVRNSGMKHCLSNHVNAGGGDGAEFIVSKFATKSWATLMKQEIEKEGQNVRRIFSRTTENGDDYYFMHRETGMVEAIIAEYGFADSKADDVEQLRRDQIKYGEAMVRAYCRYGKYKYAPPITEPASKKELLYTVQVGAFFKKENASVLALELQGKGYPAFVKEVKR